jgi:hypothetical protein
MRLDQETATGLLGASWAGVLAFVFIFLSIEFAVAQTTSPAPGLENRSPVSRLEHASDSKPYADVANDPRNQQGNRTDLLQGLGQYFGTSVAALSELPNGVSKWTQDLFSDPSLFLHRAGPGLAGLGLSVPLGGIAATGTGTARVEAGAFARGTSAVTTETEYILTQTVRNNIATRPYINSSLTIREITATGRGITDPGGIQGALRYDVPGTFAGTTGIYELVIQPETNTIFHFLFRSGQ